MKKLSRLGILLLLIFGVMLCCTACGGSNSILVENGIQDGDVIEYTGEKIQFPLGCVTDDEGTIISYGVKVQVTNLADNTVYEDEYATFTLKPGDYRLKYYDPENTDVYQEIDFSIRDTTSPAVEFLDVPNGLFMQDITEDTINKLPLYNINDASMDEGIDLKRVLYFKGADDADFREYPYRDMNNSYVVEGFGAFRYELTATDIYGNQTVLSTQWKVKDRQWLPDQLPADGILADYASESYSNLVEGGDANQYYKIGNDYSDEWLPEFEGAEGVLKINMGFNESTGYGNNTIRLRLAKKLTREDLKGKYLAVRIWVEGEHLRDNFLFAGNIVDYREEGSTRAFSTGVAGLKTGKWQNFYISGDMAEKIGIFPNATLNPDTNEYVGGDAADCIQLCFHRDGGYFSRMDLYIDNISIAEFLPGTELTVADSKAFWTAVEGATGYLVDLNGTESVITETEIALPEGKGYIRVTPKGNGATLLDGETATGVYGLDAGDSLASFNDPLYSELVSDILKFSDENSHFGYRPKNMNFIPGSNDLAAEIGTGNWGVVTGVRILFPNPKAKGNNTTLIMKMSLSNTDYDQIRVYDYDGALLQTLKLTPDMAGKMLEYEVDISSYNKVLKGVQLIFGPNKAFSNVGTGVNIVFDEFYLKNTYTPVTVDGISLMCAGERTLTPHYTTKDLVQFADFFNFNVKSSQDAKLNFSGTVKLDGKPVKEINLVGYPDVATICFKLPHGGKVLTIMEGSYIYQNGVAVKIAETFNARWDGSSWIPVANIPAEPAPEYVTLSDGSKKLVENKLALEPGYTTESVVQFTNVLDFGAPESDTPLGFEGVVMLDGEKVYEPIWVGYPKNTTISLKLPHNGKLLTVLKGAVIYYGDTAVVVNSTFNMKWNGSAWKAVSDVPEVPATRYVTLADGTQRELVAKVELTPGYTLDHLMQFTNVYDFGAPADSTPIGFEGTVLLQGSQVSEPSFNSYLNSTTIGLEKLNHKGKVVTIMEGAILYNDTHAVQVAKTFNALWDGTSWTAVEEIPEPSAPQEGVLSFEYRYGAANLIQVNTNLPTELPIANFLVSDNGSSIDESANQYQRIGWIGMDNVDGTIVLTFHYNANFSAGQTYFLPAGAVFGFTDGSKFTLDQDYTFYFDGAGWTVNEVVEPPTTEPPTTEPPATEPPTEPEEGVLNLSYRYGTNNLIQMNTDLPFSTPCVNFLASDNGCVIDQSGNRYQQVGWIGMDNVSGTVVLTFHFNSNFAAGQDYTLPAGCIFGFTDGNTYTLDKDYTFAFDGSQWTMTATEPEEEPPVTEPPVTEPPATEPPATEPGLPVMNFTMKGGNSKIIQVYTDLPATTPIADFTAADNGCEIDETGNLQAMKDIKMRLSGNQIHFMIWFNNAYTAGQTYTLPAGSVFGFTDGSKYTLDKNYIFTYNGSAWSMVTTEPAEPTLILQYRYGTNGLIQVNTNLPEDTPLANFLTSDNGCVIDQSANLYQQIGWIGMDKVDSTVILTFHFNSAFQPGQTYFLPKGALFGFTNGLKYALDQDYTFLFDGSVWAVNEP